MPSRETPGFASHPRSWVGIGVLAPNDARVRLGLPRIAGLDDPAPVISGITPAANLADAEEGDPPYE